MQVKGSLETDLYVVMGAAVWEGGVPSNAMRRRVEGALCSSRSSGNPGFLVTGGVGRFPPSEARVMQKLLMENGVFEKNVFLEEESTDTLSSARNCARMIRGMAGIKTVTVCTDRYHLLRTRWIFYLLGLRTRPGQVANGLHQTGLRKWIFYWLREVPAVIKDTFLVVVFR